MVLGGEKDDVDAMEEKERNLAFWSGAEIGVWYSIGYLSQAEGLQTVAAGKSAFFNALAVIVVPILDALIKGKILQRKEIAAVGLACLGVGLLEVGPSGLMITPGDILAFMQTIFFGIGYWRLEAVSHAHPHQAARITVGQLGAVATGATIYALTEFGLGHLELSIDQFVQWMGDPFILGALMWTGLISTALALYLETVALKVVSATELTLLMTTTSLWGASFAYVTIGETLSPTGFMGGLMILGGCVLGNTAAPAPKEKMDTPMAAIDQHMEDRPLVS
jgi:drug/metabolite transporter (DMT)-like permease